MQVGDPFMEKLLLEACLEAMQTGAIVGIQDMGAAGLTCSTCEMGGRGGVGLEIELDLVPQRDTGMTPYEIMLSESQERMLLVAEKGREDEVFRVFQKWGLDAVTIGRVIDQSTMRVLEHGKVVAEIPNAALTDEAPLYHRPLRALGAAGRARVAGGHSTRAEERLHRRVEAVAGEPEYLLEALGLSSSTTRWCRPTPWRGRATRRA